jgi:cbb3-type cytochrome oxidase subunit 3
MIKEFLAASTALNMEMLGSVIFTVVFIIINIWVFRKSGKKMYSDLANLPLTNEKEI